VRLAAFRKAGRLGTCAQLCKPDRMGYTNGRKYSRTSSPARGNGYRSVLSDWSSSLRRKTYEHYVISVSQLVCFRGGDLASLTSCRPVFPKALRVPRKPQAHFRTGGGGVALFFLSVVCPLQRSSAITLAPASDIAEPLAQCCLQVSRVGSEPSL